MDARLIGIHLRDNDGPRYQQIFDQVAERVRNGTLPAGFRLPPSRALAEILAVHRNTVVRAYAELQQAGFIECGVGRGTFVLPQARAGAVAPPLDDAGLPWETLTSGAARTSAMRSIGRLARAPVPRGVIRLSGMQPPEELLPHELLRRCLDHVLQTVGPKALGYAPRDGVLRLRMAIVEDLARQGVPARVEDLLITTGSQQALDLLGRALIEPEEPLLVQQATYTGAIQVFSSAGARLISVPSDGEGPSLGALDRLAIRARGFYLMPNHCNPTGEEISEARRRELCRWARQRNVPLIEDDYAADLVLDDHPPVPAMRSLDGEVIYVGTYSKKLIPALRIGFIVCPPGLKPELVSLKHSFDLGSSTLMQFALAEFLDRGYMAAHLNTLRRVYRTRRAALVDALRQHLPKEIRFRVPRRGLTLWLDLPEGVRSEEVFEEAMRHRVLVSPGMLHRSDGEAAGIRLTFCSEKSEHLVEGARRLGAALTEVLKTHESDRDDRRPAIGIV
ncbi:MAG: PLP-dependent aminotransferase family protein [Myxococcota bacterium]